MVKQLVRLVLISNLHYSAYKGKKFLGTVTNPEALSAEYVEHFRLHAEAVLDELTEPEVA